MKEWILRWWKNCYIDLVNSLPLELVQAEMTNISQKDFCKLTKNRLTKKWLAIYRTNNEEVSWVPTSVASHSDILYQLLIHDFSTGAFLLIRSQLLSLRTQFSQRADKFYEKPSWIRIQSFTGNRKATFGGSIPYSGPTVVTSYSRDRRWPKKEKNGVHVLSIDTPSPNLC
jgi:hypothetical protein